MSKVRGIVLESRRYRGGAISPALSLEDISRWGNDGTFTNTTWVQLASGLWVMTFNGTDTLVDCGDCVLARTLALWINPDSTTESVLEETAAVGVTLAGGSVVYGSWDNCFVDGVDTDTITTGWHHLAITSTTDVDVSAFRLGLVNVTYFDGEIGMPRLFRYEINAGLINSSYASERTLFGV